MKRGKRFLLIGIIIVLFLSLHSVNALIISEIESNPDGTDSKNEWIELYSEEEINGEYILVNNDAGEIYDNEDKNQLKINFNFQGYYIYNFNSQWLDNSDEKVYLYDGAGTSLIDSTNIFDDNGDSDFTWQRCNDTWIFENNTKGEINCIIEETPEENETEVPVEDEVEIEEEKDDSKDEKKEVIKETPEEKIVEKKESVVTGSVIKLDSKDIKSKKSTEEIDKSNLATIGLGLVVILLLLLLVSQKYKQNKKNEFR